ncbi:MAG: cytochrome b/b6 domain-containing protein [Paracoccaceae bacterium]|nr:MAG: cytochrome b/b6 domain-containing protein [Paracoccaceae bacterium]
MPLLNSATRYGSVARALHWLTALLILTAIPLGIVANDLAYDTSAALAWKAQVFSWHKTVGVAAFFVALARILWALTQPRPAPLHPDRTWETRAAEAVHWLLYISLIAVPLSGWVHHAATAGFAPILWPLGQDLPMIPKSAAVEHGAAAAHWVFTKLLIAAILLHVAGAVKHAVIDRDATVARMWRGTSAPRNPQPHRARGPLLAAVAAYAAGVGLAVALTAPDAGPVETTAPATAEAGNWQVEEGTLSFTLRQMGSTVEGRFATWTARITFDDTVAMGAAGRVDVMIDMASSTIGSVTAQAQGPEFLNVAGHPAATFTAEIRRDDGGYVADGVLTLAGVAVPVALPFDLAIEEGIARMSGRTAIDRRDFGIGRAYGDEGTVGFAVTVDVVLTATRR